MDFDFHRSSRHRKSRDRVRDASISQCRIDSRVRHVSAKVAAAKREGNQKVKFGSRVKKDQEPLSSGHGKASRPSREESGWGAH